MKIFFKFCVMSIVLALGLLPTAYAAATEQFSIVPTSTATISLSAGTPSTVTYNVTANQAVQHIQVSPSSEEFQIPNYITATATGSCIDATLASGGTCSFTLFLATAADHAGQSFTLAPRVSGNEGGANSHPSESNRIQVSITNTPSTYTVSTNTPSNGTISCTPTTVNSGSNSTCTITAASGYSLTGLTDNGTDVLSQVTGGNTYVVSTVTADHTINATFSLSTTAITANATTTLFSFNNANASGSVGTGYSVITITNSGSADAANVVAITPLPTGVTQSATTCTASLAASSSCTITFTTAATPDSTQTILIKGDNTNTLALPIAPLSVRVYSPPVNPAPSNASLMLVKTCSTPEQLLLTNNSGSPVTTISVTKDSNLSDVSLTSVMDNCPATLPAGKSCVLGVTAPSSSGSTNTQGNILINWASSQSGAVFTGIEATGATLPSLSTPSSAVTVYGGYVYQEDTTCNLVKVAALADQYAAGGGVAWSTVINTTVPNPATGSGTGAQNIGLAAGQINTAAVIYQAGTPLTSYAAGLCSQYSETSSGSNYVGWYLPWDNGDSSGSTTTELAAMYTNLKSGQADGTNGFANQFYWSSSEFLNNVARVRFFNFGNPSTDGKGTTSVYVRCSRALTY